MKSRHTYKYDVGISYARADEALVQAVVSQLRDEFGLSVFIGHDHIVPSEDIRDSERFELAEVFENQCALVAALVTNEWIDSVWCRQEFSSAFRRMRDRRQHCFLPLRFCDLDGRKETGLEEAFQMVDLTNGLPTEVQYFEIADVILAFFILHFERKATKQVYESPFPPFSKTRELKILDTGNSPPHAIRSFSNDFTGLVVRLVREKIPPQTQRPAVHFTSGIRSQSGLSYPVDRPGHDLDKPR